MTTSTAATAATAPIMALEDRLEALAELHTLPHGAAPVHHDWMPDCACSSVETLVYQLRQIGIEPTDAARYDQLTTITAPRPSFEPSSEERLIDLSAADYTQRLTERSFTAAVEEQWGVMADYARATLQGELRTSMRSEAASYIDELRPAFEHAFGIFRQAVALGIQPNTTVDKAIDLEPTAVAMWRLLNTNLTASVLNAILGVRIRITTALNVDPGPDALIDGTYGHLLGHDGGAFRTYRNADWTRWLAVAQRTPEAQLAGVES